MKRIIGEKAVLNCDEDLECGIVSDDKHDIEVSPTSIGTFVLEQLIECENKKFIFEIMKYAGISNITINLDTEDDRIKKMIEINKHMDIKVRDIYY